MRSKNGSALLVVLGMLSFMLFSGLAFSVYMRYSRLSTSFLRRTCTTRQLAKAAVAEAINDIDLAIGNDPHPGIIATAKSSSSYQNIWLHRVFIGDTDNYTDINDTTVSVLPLEGLAYLPPNLINEVRYLSRCTPTAMWQTFWFDSGRYAYVAVDVSDYFDVNRMIADLPRASSANRRLGFAHLFETISDGDHTAAGKADEWDDFLAEHVRSLDDYGNITFKNNPSPFISMADFNCAMNQQTIGGMKSPFYSFLNSNDGEIYDCDPDLEEGHYTDPDAMRYGMMTFVANGYFPTPTAKKSADGKSTITTYSLDEAVNQPFKSDQLMKDAQPELDNFADYAYSDSGAQKWQVGEGNEGRLNLLNQAALWDYLDADSIPCSICIPTTERTPMICGVSPQYNGSELAVKVTQTPAKGSTDSDKMAQQNVSIGGEQWDLYSREITYTLDLEAVYNALNTVSVLLCYPFREHGLSGWDDATYKLDGRLALFLTESGNDISIHPSKFKSYLKKGEMENTKMLDKSVICFPLKESKNITPKNDIVANASNAEMPCMLQGVAIDTDTKPSDAEMMIAKIKYTWPRDKYVDSGDGDPKPQTVNPDPIMGDNTTVEVTEEGLCYLANNGEAKSLKEKLQNKETIKLKLNIATWVRLKNKDGDTVDLVPACSKDDVDVAENAESKCAQEVSGGELGYPLLRATAAAEISMGIDTLVGTSDTLGTVEPPAAKWLIADPRYNYAAANWVKKSDSNLQADDWSNSEEIKNVISSGDGDAYMSTSDAGYMQSIFELAFLPRVSNGFGGGDLRGNMFSGKLPSNQNNFNPGDYPTAFTSAKDANFMWKTYDPFGRWNADEFSDLTDIIVTGDGMKVNPFSRSTDVLMAAFANTPLDWRCASTNYTALSNRDSSPEFKGMKSSDFNAKYAWNSFGNDSKQAALCWDCLSELAEKFQSNMSSAKSVDEWQDVYDDDLGWNTTDKRKIVSVMDALDQDDSNIYSVDRKFFYGFWRECFAARQQLFLIFVRAEPMMMGGGVNGQTPPQLGARAVAVVWRDPTATTASSSGGNAGDDDSATVPPHRSRILFYHQFD